VIVGRPDPAGVVPVRAHSSCFTGDLLGSLRCDCGEQLQTAVKRLHEAGGGVLLYLAQEGRGIGLANKLRAYQLQDDGLDTLDADRHLGFSADERSYAIAAAMLRQLGFTRIRLLTNSPHKLRELRARGIDVQEMESLVAAPNVHNERYIRTKRDRAGHFIPGDQPSRD
jgi:GTP cyclohydrolase II